MAEDNAAGAIRPIYFFDGKDWRHRESGVILIGQPATGGTFSYLLEVIMGAAYGKVVRIRKDIFFAFAAAFTGTFSLQLHAERADFCLITKDRSGGGQVIVNICSEPVEAAWCHFEDNGCSRLNNTWTIQPGGEYPIDDGAVVTAGCSGENSISGVRGMSLDCD